MCNIFHKYIFWTSTMITLQHFILMSPPSSCHADAAQHCCHHHRHCAATAATMLPRCCHHTDATATPLLPLRCCLVRRRVTTKLLPLPLPPCRYHCHLRCQAATVTTKLLPLPLSTLWDRFDDEKVFCKMTYIDFSQLFWLFQPDVNFLHGGILSIFDTLVYLLLNHIHL